MSNPPPILFPGAGGFRQKAFALPKKSKKPLAFKGFIA